MLEAKERQPEGLDSDAEHNIDRVIQTTAQQISDGENVTGGPHVEQYAPGLVGQLGPILGFKPRRHSYRRTDIGNAERFADMHGKNVRWVSKWHKHFIWTGRVWALDEREEISSKAQATATSIFSDASKPGVDKDEQKKIVQHAMFSQSAPRIRAMIDLAKPHMAASHTDFDPDPWLLNCQNGTIDLRTGELREHRRSDLITKVSPVEYDPEARAPVFEAFLEQILKSEALREFVQRAFGAALPGEVRDNFLTILHGTGSNGKSTLVEAIMQAFGEYAIVSAPDLLMSKANTHPTELADLFGARLVVCMESEEGRRLNEGLVKQLTGRDKIRARRMREDLATGQLSLGSALHPAEVDAGWRRRSYRAAVRRSVEGHR